MRNRKNISFVLVAIMFTLLFSGCSEKEPTYVQSEVITVSINTMTKAPTELSAVEFEKLTTPEVKEMIETYLPNYREVYGIDKDREMSEEDWLQLKDLMYYQLYGDFLNSYQEELASSIDFSKPFEIMGDDGTYLDPNWIYYAPCSQYIKQLSVYDFGKYMNGLMAYTGQDLGSNDFTTMSEEELEELRTKALNDLCVDWGSVEIPTLGQLAKSDVEAAIIEGASENDVEDVQISEDSVEVSEEDNSEDE